MTSIGYFDANARPDGYFSKEYPGQFCPNWG